MNRHLSILLGLLLCAPTLWAGPIDKEQALEKAREFYSSRGQTSKVRKLKQVPRATEVSTAMENDCFYVFNAGEDDGYVIISGDDRTPDVLGYADSGTFRADDMPENMKSWLDEYAAQIRYLQQNGDFNSPQTAAAPAKIATHPAVEPLVKTKWNQDAPYNNQCPVFFNESKYGRTVTGCVAAAMAQVMKFWNYPKSSLRYIYGYPCNTDWSSYIGSSSRSVITVPDVGSPTFDWNNMLNTYDNGASEAQKKAVATLMQACATALSADFGITAVGGTSARTQSLKNVLTRYFDYDNSMKYVYRGSYNADQWDELIYSEMSAHRPVFFSGQSVAGGHTFIVDGYDGKGYYHVNWGWGGLNNGYFLLSALNPEDESGIGAGKGGYNLQVTALIGVKPNAGGDNPSSEIMTVEKGQLWKTSFTRSSTSDDFKDISVAYSFYNYTGITTTFDFGYGIYDSNYTLKKVIPVMEKEDLLATMGYSTDETKATFNFGAGISSGEYYIMPISKLSSSDQWQPCAKAWGMYVVATISGNTLSLSFVKNKIDVKMELLNTPETKGPADLKVTFTNNGPYYNGHWILIEKGKPENRLYANHLELQKGETKTLYISIILNEQRAYTICGGTSEEDPVVAIPITPTAPKAQKLTCTYSVTNANASRQINSSQMEMTIEYQNTGDNDYDNEILLQLMKRVGTTNSYNGVAKKADRLKLAKGSKEKHSYVFSDLEDGGTYIVVPSYKSNGQYCDMNSSEPYTVNISSTPPVVGEAYAVVDGSTLTFYYDDKKSSRTGKKYAMNTGVNFPGWAVDSLSIRKAVIDASFAAYSPTTTAYWFDHLVNLTSIENLKNLNTSGTKIMQSMFSECYALKSLDVSVLDTRNVTDMRWMFDGCKSLKELNLKNLNTSKVTNIHLMFCNCSSLTTIDLSSFDTQNVTDMGALFYGCSSLTTLNLGKKFNTSKVTNMRLMFYNCASLKEIDLTSFDTRNVTDMSSMFARCKACTKIVIPFNTPKVTSLNNMFDSCMNVKTLDLSSFNTANVTTMNRMFTECYALEQLDISSFNTANVTDMSCMFYDCRSLEAVDVSSFRTLKLMDMSFMFRGCKKLKMLDLSGFTTGPVEYMNVAFYDCQSLKTIYASNDWSRINVDKSDWMFGNCYSLVGGAGTKYDANHIRDEYARIDGGTSKPGYFTYKAIQKKGDVNGDDVINVADIGSIIDVMSKGGSNPAADVNGDGVVNVADIGTIIDMMARNSRRASNLPDSVEE